MSLHHALIDELDRHDAALAEPGAVLDTASGVSAALRAVLELHGEFHYERFDMDCCGECSDVENGVFVGTPCDTLKAIARELGIEATDHG